MSKKSIFLLYLAIFCFLPMINSNVLVQAKNSSYNETSIQNTNSTGFYVYKGRVNDLTAYVKEKNQGTRFQTSYGSFDNYWINYNWQDTVGGASVYQISYPDAPSEPLKPQWLHDHGMMISIKILGGSYNPLEIDYNTTYKDAIINDGLQTLNTLSYIKYVDEIIIGDEAPATLYNWQDPMSQFDNPIYSIYNSSLHDETGVWMKNVYNSTELWIVSNWIDNKTMTAMNSIYYGLKQVYPDKLIGWGTMPWPGFEPTLMKWDFLDGGYYTNSFQNFYSDIRFAKLVAPNKPVYSVVMGATDPPDGISLQQQEQFFWTAYFAGSSRVDWFAGGNNAIYNSIGSTAELTNYEFHSNLDKLADSLPVINPKPLVLQINAMKGDEVGQGSGFREYDSATQTLSVLPTFSFNQYKIIVFQEQYQMLDSLTNKLTNYINSGGNLILKGFAQPLGISENASGQLKSVFLPPEKNGLLTTKQFTDKEILNFKSSLFNTVIPNLKVQYRRSLNFTASPDWTPIPTGLPEESQGYYPIAVYHNVSDPNSGYILYYGFASSSDDNLYIPLIQNYVVNYLGLKDLVTPQTNPHVLVSTSLDNYNRTIIGVVPDSISSTETINLNYTERNLPQDNVWMYNGFNKTVWDDRIYDPTDPSAYGMAKISIPINQYSPMRYIITPRFPSPEPDLQVQVKYPDGDPYVGEKIPLTVYVNEPLQYVNLNNFKITLSTPLQITIDESAFPSNQSLDNLQATTRNTFQWLITANTTGLFNLSISITSANITRTLQYSIPLRVNEGRVEIHLPNILYFVSSDQIRITGSLFYQGEKTEQFSIFDLIRNYIWGNPGGLVENVTLQPGEQYNFDIPVNAYGYRSGDSGVFQLTVYNKEHTTLSEDFVLIKIYPALLNISSLVLNNGFISSTIGIKGVGSISNVQATLYAGGNTVANSGKFLGTLSSDKSYSITWNVSNLLNQSSFSVLVTGNNVPSISKNLYLTKAPQTIIYQENTTMLTTTQGLNLTNIFIIGPLIVLTSMGASVISVFAYGKFKKSKLIKKD